MTRLTLAATGVVALFAFSLTTISARQPAAIAVDGDDIGGVVRSSKGAEAGVWVIAETKDLPTPFVKIVVTDDQGRYLLPDLPKANYSVFVRGYGLVDSNRVTATPGKPLNLTAVIAPNDHAAARTSSQWLSLLRIPEGGDFPARGRRATASIERQEPGRVGPLIKSVAAPPAISWARRGREEIPKELGTFPSLQHAWGAGSRQVRPARRW